MTRLRPSFSSRSQRGSALLAALCFATVLLVALGSYITVCYQSLALSTRSLHTSRSVQLAETGMEDALWALNNNNWSGWTINGTTATKSIGGFTFENGVTGSVTLAITSYDGSAGTRRVSATGRTQEADGTVLSRELTATSAEAPLFVNAIAATNGTVSFSSAGTVDSYDSSVGQYGNQTPGYSAVVASLATPGTAATVQLTNAQVKGFVSSLWSSGPSYSSNGKVVGPTTPTATHIDASRISTSPYQPVFNIKTVTGSGSVLPNPSTGSTTNIGSPGDTSPQIFYSSGLNLTGTTKIIVNGPVRLVVSGAFYVGLNGGTPSIEITNNGTLEVFVSGDVAVYGNGIDNQSRDPSRLAIYGTAALTVPDLSTTVPYYGVVYLPNSTFTVRGNAVIYGAIVAKKVSLAGSSPAVHYDVNLRDKVFDGIETPFAVSDWRETTNES